MRIGRAGSAQQGDPGVVRTRDFQLSQADGAIGEVALDFVGQSFVDRAAAEVGELIGGWVGVGREGCRRHAWEPRPDEGKPLGRATGGPRIAAAPSGGGWPGRTTKTTEPKVAANQAGAHGGGNITPGSGAARAAGLLCALLKINAWALGARA